MQFQVRVQKQNICHKVNDLTKQDKHSELTLSPYSNLAADDI